MDPAFPEIVLVIGVLLLVTSALSGLARGTILSVSVLAVLAGIVLDAAGAVDVTPGDPGVTAVVELALIFTLFSDGMIVERELLVGHRAPAARALAIAMPLTAVFVGVAAKLLFPELDWVEAFLIGAIVAPTDPVITSSVVAARGVPAELRHTLNLESGLNDGLALPFVLVLIAISAGEGSAGIEAAHLIGEAFAGLLIGIAVAALASRAAEDISRLEVDGKFQGVYALGIGLVAYGISEMTIGNGFIATFAAGITLGVTEHSTSNSFQEFNESLSSVLQTVTLFLFGALIVEGGMPSPVLAGVALAVFTLAVGRPGAVMVAMVRSEMPRVHRAFLAWFGPKGVASMLFALFVLESDVPDRGEIFQIVSVIILASILAHGLTDTVGARWINRRLSEESDEEREPDRAPLTPE